MFTRLSSSLPLWEHYFHQQSISVMITCASSCACIIQTWTYLWKHCSIALLVAKTSQCALNIMEKASWVHIKNNISWFDVMTLYFWIAVVVFLSLESTFRSNLRNCSFSIKPCWQMLILNTTQNLFFSVWYSCSNQKRHLMSVYPLAGTTLYLYFQPQFYELKV